MTISGAGAGGCNWGGGCSIVTSTSTTCSGTASSEFTGGAYNAGTSDIDALLVDTTNKVAQAYYCLRCIDTDATFADVNYDSNPFQMQVKACQDYVTLPTLSATYANSVPVTSGSGFQTLLSPANIATTTDSTNCAITYLLRDGGTTTTYSGSFLSHSAGTIQYNPDAINSESVYVQVTAGQSSGFTQASSTFTVSSACAATGYTITEVSSPTNPQYISHLLTNGFNLPTYQSSQNTACPINNWQVTNANSGAVSIPGGLNDQVLISATRVVKPSTSTTHLKYTFYTKITASGGTAAYFGPYYLDVGCTATSVSFTNSGSFVTSVPLSVGAGTANVYTLADPTASRAWCVITKNEIVDATDGVTLFSTKLNQCGSDPCSVFSLISTSIEEVINFKVLTTWTNSLTSLSAQATITITCSAGYTVTEVSAPTNPQYISHGVATAGFVLPTYQSSQNTGCPIQSWQVTNAASGAVSIPSGLNDQILESLVHIVKPTNNALHQKYTFYTKIIATGNSEAYFGPYYVDVGCTATSVSFSDNGAFVTDVPLFVGAATANVYTFQVPTITPTRAYCSIVNYAIKDVSGGTYSGPARFATPFGCAAQPSTTCTVFSLAATTYPEVINFAILTTFTNLNHLSAATKFTITCTSSYTVTESPANPAAQYVTHGGGASTTEGYTLPTYTSAQNTGCPINTWQISNVNTAVTAVTGMPSVPVVDGADREARPSDGDLHASYTFYIKATASDGASTGYFGQYTLYVGCISGQVTFADHGSFISSVAVTVGDPIAGIYTFYNPTQNLAWCTSTNNEIVTTAGGTPAPAKLTTGTQRCDLFGLVDTINPEVITFKVKSTMQSLILFHTSATVTITLTCGSAYTFTEGTVSTKQYKEHNLAASGFNLATYTSSQNTGCPVTLWEISNSNSAVNAVTGLNSPIADGSGGQIVKPTVNTLQTDYSFFVKVTAPSPGFSSQFFGPFQLNIGCFYGSVTFSDAASIVSNQPIFVGASLSGVYTLVVPTSTRSYCLILSNEIVNTDGSMHDGSKIVQCATASQPCTSWDLVSSSTVEVINFKILTAFTNARTHYSAALKITITCGSTYTITESATPTNPQYVKHGDSSVGFILPVYVSSEPGCPPNVYQISTSNTVLTLPSNLNQPVLVGSDWIVKPTNNALHFKYEFYAMITSDTNNVEFFPATGKYYLDVGCTATSVVYADSASLVTNTALTVGPTIANIYTFAEPTATRAWCTTTNNQIVNVGGAAWSGSGQVTATQGCGSQPPACTVFSLVSASTPETISFQINTQFQALTHLSTATLTFTITCGTYTVWSASATNPQYVTHNSATVGFTLPTFYTSYSTGCPINSRLISSSNLGVFTPSGLNQPILSASYKVLPTINIATTHTEYSFYVKAAATAGTGSSRFFPTSGIYTLHIGCTASSVTFSDSNSPSIWKPVGVALTNAWYFTAPGSTRFWCSTISSVIINQSWTTPIVLTPNTASQPSGQYSIDQTDVTGTWTFQVQSTMTNALVHTSSTLTLKVFCENYYTITESTAPTNPQIKTHGVSTVGFILPTYTHTSVVGCPITNWEVSQYSSTIVAYTTLQSPVMEGTDRVVKPTDNNAHQGYLFYLKVSAYGDNSWRSTSTRDSSRYFGPYDLRIGCYANSFTVTDSPSLATTIPQLYVGDPISSTYTFVNPAPSVSWCVVVTNDIVKTDSSNFMVQKYAGSYGTVQPFLVFDLITTSIPEEFNFKVKTTFPGGYYHLSPSIKTSIICNNNYILNVLLQTDNPQYISHDDSSYGFKIPKYYCSQQWGCPVSSYKTSATNTFVNKPQDLRDPIQIYQDRYVLPTNKTKHWMYKFYIQATADGGSNAIFGEYFLYVGCMQQSLSIVDNPEFIVTYPIGIGHNTTAFYRFYQPTTNLTYCSIQQNQIVDINGNFIQSNDQKLVPTKSCSISHNCTLFDLVSTEKEDFIQFRVKSSYENQVYHLSPVVSISIAAIYTRTEEDGNSTNKAIEDGAFPFTKLIDLPKNEPNISTYSNGLRDVNQDYNGEIVLTTVFVTIVGSVAFAASRMYMSKSKTQVIDSQKIQKLSGCNQDLTIKATTLAESASAQTINTQSGMLMVDDPLVEQEQFDIHRHYKKQERVHSPDGDWTERPEGKDNRTLLEKLKEPGQKGYNNLYSHISRLTRPQNNITIRQQRELELQEKKEINDLEIKRQNREHLKELYKEQIKKQGVLIEGPIAQKFRNHNDNKIKIKSKPNDGRIRANETKHNPLNILELNKSNNGLVEDQQIQD